MHNTREKLVALLQKPIEMMPGRIGSPCIKFTMPYAEELSDHLIAHGVTAQEWIPVKDRLPEIDTQVLCFTGSSVQLAMYEGNDKWFTNYHSYTLEGKNLFTHWMPLPQPPKGE